ncbi:MAG TPA: metalloregulator ArsR/SmtB family transcription factor [Flavisolibacter sp.]|nr:metalloregulator ArsR/SmtB family transcription factor [Flavisolibacter sp.]
MTDTTKKAALVLRAVNHKLRQQVITYLRQHPGTNVTALYVHFRLEQSIASQHLAILRRQGLVTATRRGKQILYSVNEIRLQEVQQLAAAMIGAKPVAA